ncbi:MAG: hypothetical protein ACTHLX_16155 [Candidatus Binatia bacterium]
MSASAEQIDQQIANHKTEAQKQLRKLATGVDQHQALTTADKQAIGSLLDSVDQQITVIQSSSREMFATARGQLRDNMRKVQAELDKRGDELLRRYVRAWRRAMEKLDEQLEAAEKHFSKSGE